MEFGAHTQKAGKIIGRTAVAAAAA